jgi:excisionase family DNA binding protein
MTRRTATASAPASQGTLLLTIPEAAAELRIGKVKVYELISDGELDAIDIARPGSKRTHLRVPRTSLDAYVKGCPRVLNPTP